MKTKKSSSKKKSPISTTSTDPLTAHLHTLDQILINTKATTDAKCKQAVWYWLSNHNMYLYFVNETRSKDSEQVCKELFIRVSVSLLTKEMCLDHPLTLTKFKTKWKKAINEFKQQAAKLAKKEFIENSMM